MSEVMNIPRLRFNHFDKEWTLSKVFETGKILTGSTPPTNNPEYYDGNFLFVSPSDLGSKKYISETSKRVSRLGLETGRVIPENSIMFVGIGSTIGKVGVSTETCITNQQIHTIVPNPKFNTDFVYYVLRKNKSKIRLLAGTQAVPQLNKTDFSKLNYYYPSLPEQQKIADFLTAVDKRIELLEKKMTLLETYKKGVMKKIFNQEIRFKDNNGNDFPDWEEKRLGDISNITIGEFVIKTKQSPESEYPVYNGGKSWTGFYDEYNNEGNKILISARGANAGFVNFEKKRFWAGNSCYSIDMIDQTKHKIEYFFFYIKCFENRFTDYQQAANIPSVSKKDVTVFKVSFPSYNEQDKIHRFLENIDAQIKLLGVQIEKSKTWKKGLLQKMFV